MEESYEKSFSKVPALGSSNFLEWIDVLQDVLEGKGLWEYVEVAASDLEEDEKTQRKNSARALAIIKSTVNEEQRAHLLGLRSPKEALEKLQSIHQVPSEERVQRLLSDFHEFQWAGTIDGSASKLSRLQLQIAAAKPDERPSDAAKKAVFVRSLPEAYQTTVLALRAAGMAAMSYDEVMQRLKEVELSLKDQGGQELARFAKRQQGQWGVQPRKKLDKRDIECFNCHKRGHIQRNCRAPKQEPREEANAAWMAVVTTAGLPKQQDPNEWVLDSGCTQHMTFNRSLFVDYTPYQGEVRIANGQVLEAPGQGTIEVQIGGNQTTIADAIYVPRIGYNLLSVSQLADRGMTFQFRSQKAQLTKQGRVVATAIRQGKAYVLRTKQVEVASLSIAQDAASRLWHRRLGHPGEQKMQQLAAGGTGVPADIRLVEACETCELTKAVRIVSKEPAEMAQKRLERVYIDYWGPFKHQTLGGKRYMLTITDDYTRKSWIFLEEARHTLQKTFWAWKEQAEQQSGCQLQAIRLDNAAEFRALAKALQEQSIRIEFTVPYTPEQNGVAERLNRTLITTARSMLVAAGLPKELWGEAVHAAAYLKNRTPQQGEQSPEELWTGRRPSLGHLRVFGYIAYSQIPKERRANKLEHTAAQGVFVGYTETSKQYRILDPRTKLVRLTSSVRFNESAKGGQLFDSQAEKYVSVLDKLDVEEEEPKPSAAREQQERAAREAIEAYPEAFASSRGSTLSPAPSSLVEPESSQVPRRSGRVPRPVRQYSDTAYGEEAAEPEAALKVDYTPQELPITPKNYKEAVSSKEKRLWRLAIKDQVDSLASNHTWEVVEHPGAHTNLIDTKWVFKIKQLPNGQVDKYKARLVARGFSQQPGVDFFETFSPVVRMESLRILLAIAAVYDLEVHQMDVVSAYLLGELDEDVYLKAPDGIDMPAGKVLKLRKGLYGLKQSGRIWNSTIGRFFGKNGFCNLPGDQSIWINREKRTIVALYVDDIIIAAPGLGEVNWIKELLKQEYKIQDLGEISTILGVRIQRDRSKRLIQLDQAHYIRELLAEHAQSDKEARVPARGYENLGPIQPGEPSADMEQYQTLVGKLNWLVRASRPDIAFVAQRLSQFCHNPAGKHAAAAQQVLQYLRRTTGYGIQYAVGTDSAEGSLCCYSDADYAADTSSRRSTMGYVSMLAGGAVSWSSRLQRTISTSTTEAEYGALAYAGKEVVWIRSLLSQLGKGEFAKQPTPIYGDNQGSIALVKNPEFHARTKHIDVSIHYVREIAEDSKIDIQYISTKDMAADCLTKPLPAPKHEANVAQIGLKDWEALKK